MGSLRDRGWRYEDVTDSRPIGPLDGLATTIRFRLSSLSAGPDAMEAGVVFAGCTIPPDGLSIAHPYPVVGPLARSGRDGVGVVCLCLGSSGWSPLAAMMPILRKSVGGYRPQFPVKESIRFHCLAPLGVLATLADDEAAGIDDDMDQPRWLKVGRDKPQLCARESNGFFRHANECHAKSRMQNDAPGAAHRAVGRAASAPVRPGG